VSAIPLFLRRRIFGLVPMPAGPFRGTAVSSERMGAHHPARHRGALAKYRIGALPES